MKQSGIKVQQKKDERLQYYIDCHTHLLDYGKQSNLQLQQILNQAYISNVKFIVANTTCSNEYQPMIHLYQKYRNQANFVRIVPSFGIHPCYIQQEVKLQNWKNWDINLNQILKQNPQYCVGQIGLDFRTNVIIQNPKQLQMEFFTKQLQIAFQLNRPVSVHCIRAYSDILKQMKKIDKQYQSKGLKNPTSIIFHSYGGSKEITKSLLKLNNLSIYFSLSLKRSVDLCGVIPLQKLIFQTDSPYQSNKQLTNEIKTTQYSMLMLKDQIKKLKIEHQQTMLTKQEQLKQKEEQNQVFKAQFKQKEEKQLFKEQLKQKEEEKQLLKDCKYFNKSILDNKPSYVLLNYKTLAKCYNLIQKDFTNIITKNALIAFKLIK